MRDWDAANASDTADWLQPPAEQEGLARYAETLRERAWIVVVAVVVATGLAIAYVLTADKVYEAEAQLLITPVSSEDITLASLGLIQTSANPAQPVETAATVVTGNDVAALAIESEDLDLTARELRDQVTARPVAESDVVAITAQGPSPEEAALRANALAEAAVVSRTERLHQDIRQVIPQLQDQLASPALGQEPRQSLGARIAQLRTLASTPTPEMRVEAEAEPPIDPVAPRPMLSVTAGIVGGLILGVVAAFGAQALDPRLRRDEQLRRLYRLPILARIPKETRRGTANPLGPRQLSPAASEAYRTLRGTLAVAGRKAGSESRAILVTGSSSAEGKTTTAVNLAASLAGAGRSVILIEADLRRPAIGRMLRIERSTGIVGVLIESVALEDALLTNEQTGANVGLLLADYEGGWISEVFSLPAARQLVEAARQIADYVIIDSPPLTDVIDALPLVDYVDDVLIVVRPGRTDLRKLGRLGEILAENGTKPAGFAVVGAGDAVGDSSYYHAPEGGAPGGRALFSRETAKHT